jgi:hypothetical protein
MASRRRKHRVSPASCLQAGRPPARRLSASGCGLGTARSALLGRAPLTAVRTFVSVCNVQPTAASALVRDENNGTTTIRCRLRSFASLPIQGNDDLMAQLGNRSCSCLPEAPPAGPAVALRGSHGHRFQIPLSGRPHIFITAVAHVVSWESRSVLWLFRHPSADHEHGEYCHVSDGFSHSEHAGTRLRGQSGPTHELPKAMENADRRYIALEEMTDQEIERFRQKREPHPGRRSEQRAARSPKGS